MPLKYKALHRAGATVGKLPTVRVNTSAYAARLTGHLRFIDFLRAVAAQLIVWHHLAFYGPLSDIAHPLTPHLLDGLHFHARMAVQVFLVIGGFVTAHHLERLQGVGVRKFFLQLARRYRRTGGPYVVVLVMALVANAVAAHWMDHRSISAPPSVAQLLAHVFYLQDVLGYQALSAGIWYLAIDFQLFALVLALSGLTRWLGRALALQKEATSTLTRITYATLAVASLFWFNRDSGFDHWAIYFFGAYFVGMVLRWALGGVISSGYLWAYLALMMLAVAVEWRVRLLVAALTAVIIMFATHRRMLQQWPGSSVIAYLGQTSFSLFLVHFPICLVVNAWFSRFALSPAEAWVAMFVAYAASLATAAVFYRLVEQPFARGGVRALVRQS